MASTFIPVNPDSHFSIQNIPFGIFRPGANSLPRAGSAIGEFVVDLSVLAENGLLGSQFQSSDSCFHKSSLNKFMDMGRPVWRMIRKRIQEILSDDKSFKNNEFLRSKVFLNMSDVVMELPAAIGDYSDFYASEFHARNCGTIFRGPENSLPRNWKYMPIGYHGRSSSIVPSGKGIVRPWGQVSPPDGSATPSFMPSKVLDFELEMAAVVGVGNKLGEPISIDEASDCIFGLVILNDWSARDIQRWEYVPLGPFLGKSFGTTISPWIVTMDALQPFTCDSPVQEPEPLPYLKESTRFSYDIHLEVRVKPNLQKPSTLICRSNLKHLYWTLPQLIAHHTINGCNLESGDLLGTGTISGPTADSLGSLLEITWGGTQTISLCESDSTRTFLEDGDMVAMTGFCQGDGYRVGFGECTGYIMPAIQMYR